MNNRGNKGLTLDGVTLGKGVEVCDEELLRRLNTAETSRGQTGTKCCSASLEQIVEHRHLG